MLHQPYMVCMEVQNLQVWERFYLIHKGKKKIQPVEPQTNVD